jgi:hypothetical protein
VLQVKRVSGSSPRPTDSWMAHVDEKRDAYNWIVGSQEVRIREVGNSGSTLPWTALAVGTTGVKEHDRLEILLGIAPRKVSQSFSSSEL